MLKLNPRPGSVRGMILTRTLAALAILFSPSTVSSSPMPPAESREAAQVAASWLGAVGKKKADDAVRSSSYPFQMLGFESPTCKGNRTARDEAALRPVVQCVINELVTEGTQSELGKQDLEALDERGLAKPGWGRQR